MDKKRHFNPCPVARWSDVSKNSRAKPNRGR